MAMELISRTLTTTFFVSRPTTRCPPQAERVARCAAESVRPIQCGLFVRTGIAGPQLS